MTEQCCAVGLLLTWATPHPPASAESDQSNDDSYCPELLRSSARVQFRRISLFSTETQGQTECLSLLDQKKSQLSQTWVWGMIWFISFVGLYPGFLGGSVVKNSPANVGDAGDVDSIPGSGWSPGVGNGNLFQYSCLGNPMDRDWWAAVHGIAKSQTWLSTHAHMGIYEEDCIWEWSGSGI